MTIVYKGTELTKIRAKTAGKNQSSVDGFYRDSDSNEYFIKKPKDKNELFTELFAGLVLNRFKVLIQELIKEGKLPPGSADSLVTADWIKFEDGSYGLIQPKVDFTPLYKIIGTGNSSGSDRDALYEILNGPASYMRLKSVGDYFGLSISLLFSLVIGAYSVHSSNMIVKEGDPLGYRPKQFGRIDWGDGWRHYGAPENNRDILSPYEYQGLAIWKRVTKNYISNYKNLPGVFASIGQKAKLFVDAMTKKAQASNPESSMESVLTGIISQALAQIPADFVSEEQKKSLAAYMHIPSFASIQFDGNVEAVAKDFARVMQVRFEQAENLRNYQVAQSSTPMAEEDLFQSILFNPNSGPANASQKTNAKTVLKLDGTLSLPAIAEAWTTDLALAKAAEIDFSEIQLHALIERFNSYIEAIAAHAEASNFWQKNRSEDDGIPANHNMLSPHHDGNNGLQYGHAFVPQYRESTILCRLLTLNPQNQGAIRIKPYEEPSRLFSSEHEESVWNILQTISLAGLDIFTSVRAVKKLQEDNSSDLTSQENIAISINNLKQALQTLKESHGKLLKLFEHSEEASFPEYDSLFFYPISDKELALMNGAQLATICLEELNASQPSLLIYRIVRDEQLWQKLKTALVEHRAEFLNRQDQCEKKIADLMLFRQQIQAFQIAHTAFSVEENLEQKELALHELEEMFAVLPEAFQAENNLQLIKAKEELRLLHLQAELDIHFAEFNAASFENFSQKYHSLCQFFEALPHEVQSNTRIKFNKQGLIHLAYKTMGDWMNPASLSSKISSFEQVRNTFGQVEEAPRGLIDLFQQLEKQHHIYQLLAQILPQNSPSEQLNIDITKLEECTKHLEQSLQQRFKTAVFGDLILWNALKASPLSQLSAEVVEDILALRVFHQQKLELNKENEFGEKYSASLNKFYEQAVGIRLSDKPAKQQADAILEAAHKEFSHRHDTRRLLADVLLVIATLFGGLGAIFMAARVFIQKQPAFFSKTATEREVDLRKWVNIPVEDEANTRLVSVPA
nr:hypothetical protein [Legionella jordanis]